MSNPVVIDTHAHVYPDSYLDRLEAAGVPSTYTAIARNLRASNEPEQMAARLAMMDTAGVGMQVLSATPQVPLVDDAKTAADAARMVNDIYRELIDTYPGRFAAYGCIPFTHPDEALTEMARCLDELGFVGIAITALLNNPDAAITDDAYRAVFEELNRRKSILYIHPTGHGAHCSPMVNHGLTWVNGAPMEDAIAVLHLMKAGYLQEFPQLRIHVAHLGGDLPFLARRLEDNYEDWGAFPASPAATMRQVWFDAANFTSGALRLAAETYDPTKLLVGSDYPYFQDDKYTRAVEYIRTAGLSSDQVEAILHSNAQALYGDLLVQ